MTAAGASIAAEVGRMTEERRLLKHPFYQAWQCGDLTPDAIWSFLDRVYAHSVAAGGTE